MATLSLGGSPAWTAEGNQAYAYFGASVASAGDVNGDGYADVIVGVSDYDNGQTDEGRAYVYHGSSTGLSETPAWTAEGNQAYAYFGYAAASAGDVNSDGYADVIVGAPWYDNGQTDEGRAYVYVGSSSGLSSAPYSIGEGDQAGAEFGYSVAAAGQVDNSINPEVIVGAPYYDTTQYDVNDGRAFAYRSGDFVSGLFWTRDGGPGDNFGASVASAGDVNGDGHGDVIVGAPLAYNSEDLFDAGRAYVFHGRWDGLSTTPAWPYLPQGDQAYARFGYSVASAGDVNGDGYADVAVSAPYYNNGQTDEGRAYVYHGSSTGLSETPAWTAEGNQASAYFGASVAFAGDLNGDVHADAIFGAVWYDNGQTDEGRAYMYQGSSMGLATTPAWTAEGNQASADFGYSVASAGDVNGDGYADVIVGAPLYDNGQTDEGRAYVYLAAPSGMTRSPAWTAEGNQAPIDVPTEFGHSVASAGDVNGDGYADVIVGAPGYDNGQTDEGRAHVYHGSSTGLAATPSWTAEADQAHANFGHSVASAGDVNGDGYADVMVGAPWYDNSQTDEGRAYVYHGSPAGLATTPAWTAGILYSYAFGQSVASAGDVNGDGYADVIVGAPWTGCDPCYEGRAYVYHGSPAGLSTTPSWTAEGNQASANLGYSVASAGDVNGDGYADVIVGAPNYDNGQTDEGRVYVYHGSSGGLAVTPTWTREINQADAELGRSVASAGDVNGDGYADVIVGARCYQCGQTDEGRAYVYHGSLSGLATTPAWTTEGNQASAHFGYSVASAGDVNGDNYMDVIIGGPYSDGGKTDEGRSYVYLGSSGGLATTPNWTAESNQAYAYFGYSVASAGDVNKDGCADVIVGAPWYDNGQTDEGRAYVYHGRGPCFTLTASIDPTAQTVYYNPACIEWVYPEAGFTGSAGEGTGSYSYSWAFGDGSSGTGNPISHTYPLYEETFSVTVTVTDSSGSQGQATATVTVRKVRFC